ncbi:MAG: glycosyltransferase family 9 protein [Acidobacteriaceae bacterium]|nr:glycosyltransferase family 9 protein [Acidobacteriaceae bacterium]MBV9780581.1 glycosyltransferase family 9 protein [Acidobacteriaceae bacterium]
MRRLLIRPGAIGDCILCFPALEYLAAEFTEIWIPGAVVPLVWFGDVVRSLASTGIDLAGVGDLAMDPKLKEKLQQFDEIVSWYGANRPEFREALTKLGVRCRFHAALPPRGSPEHAVDFFARQVGAPEALIPRIAMSGITSQDSVVVHPFSGGARKNWPLERYRELAARLGSEVEWTAGPEDVLAGAVRFTDLGELARWIRGARLYIGNDSGITHLAAAAGARTLALFGPSSSPAWAPRGSNITILWAESLEELSVEQVLDAVNGLLGPPEVEAGRTKPEGFAAFRDRPVHRTWRPEAPD